MTVDRRATDASRVSTSNLIAAQSRRAYTSGIVELYSELESKKQEGSKFMAVAEIELRVAALESEVTRLKQRLEEPAESKRHWVDEVYGAFANDPDFLEAMRLGRKYRESLRPKQTKHTAKRTTKSAASSSKRTAKPTAKRVTKRTATRTTKRRGR